MQNVKLTFDRRTNKSKAEKDSANKDDCIEKEQLKAKALIITVNQLGSNWSQHAFRSAARRSPAPFRPVAAGSRRSRCCLRSAARRWSGRCCCPSCSLWWRTRIGSRGRRAARWGAGSRWSRESLSPRCPPACRTSRLHAAEAAEVKPQTHWLPLAAVTEQSRRIFANDVRGSAPLGHIVVVAALECVAAEVVELHWNAVESR